jgi:hypothetical protein
MAGKVVTRAPAGKIVVRVEIGNNWKLLSEYALSRDFLIH